jgi:cephalosporin-C deacetylase-like acetyl esterase
MWDGKRILSDGSSQGGAQAIAVAAIDKRVGAVCARVPAITDLAGYLQEHRYSWPRYGKSMEQGDNIKREMKILPYYDGAVMLQHTNAKLWIEAGLIDGTCPAECVISAFNEAVSSDKTLYTYPYRPHIVNDMDKRVMDAWTEIVDAPRSREVYDWIR